MLLTPQHIGRRASQSPVIIIDSYVYFSAGLLRALEYVMLSGQWVSAIGLSIALAGCGAAKEWETVSQEQGAATATTSGLTAINGLNSHSGLTRMKVSTLTTVL